MGKKKRPLGILECYTWLTGIGWDHGSKWPRAALLWGTGNAVQVSCKEVASKTCSHILEHTDMQPRSASYQKLFAIFTPRVSSVFPENCFLLWPEPHAWLDSTGTTYKKVTFAEPSPRNKLEIYKMLSQEVKSTLNHLYSHCIQRFFLCVCFCFLNEFNVFPTKPQVTRMEYDKMSCHLVCTTRPSYLSVAWFYNEINEVK